MNTNKFLWIYLEPYTFVFKGVNQRVLYNSLNAAYYSYSNDLVMEILDHLLDEKNGYCISVDIFLLKEKEIIQFIRDIRSSYSGDIVVNDKSDRLPFVFRPEVRLNNDIARIKEEEGYSLGDNILENLNEVTFFIPGYCQENCSECSSYYKQFIHCHKWEEDEEKLSKNEYKDFFTQLESCGVKVINVVFCNILDNKYLSLLEYLSRMSFTVYAYVSIKNINSKIDFSLSKNINLCILIPPKYPLSEIKNRKSKIKSNQISFIHIIESYENNIFNDTENETNTFLIPYYNGGNLSFFEKNVYIELEDLLSIIVDRQTIYRRKFVNENFYGKLYISPSGNIYSNINSSPLGNIRKDELGKVVYNEMVDSKRWLLTRAKTKCKDCPNQLLCPSISNYELVIGRTLCHLMS